MIQLIVGGQTYNFPSENDSPPWGSEVTDWAQGVTDTLSTSVAPGDITQTEANINNNVSSPTNIIGLAFSTTTVRGAVIFYSVYRQTTNTGAMEIGETGQIYLNYLTVANAWTIAVVGTGLGGVTFSVTSNGQVQYTSSNMTGSSYTGTIHYRAQALSQ